MKKVDFLMAGVGGQGTILASNILAGVGLELGYDVKKAEVHGMAQRGGTVESHVRWGDKVYSPLVEEGGADYLLGFEMLEAARWPAYLNKESTVVVNRYRIAPPSVNLGKEEYPREKQLDEMLKGSAGKVIWINGTALAAELGNPAMIGVVILGALSSLIGGEEEAWLKVVESLVPAKFLELNKKAFTAGKGSIK